MVQAHSVGVSLICRTKSYELSIPHLLWLLIKLSKSHLPPCGSLICLPLTTSFLFQNLVLELCPYDVHSSPAATSNRSIVLKHCVWNESWPQYRHFLHLFLFSFRSWWPLDVLKSLSYWDRWLIKSSTLDKYLPGDAYPAQGETESSGEQLRGEVRHLLAEVWKTQHCMDGCFTVSHVVS